MEPPTIDPRWIRTERLEIIPATPQTTRAALDGSHVLSDVLRARVPSTWPPTYLDPPAFQFTLDRLAEGPGQAGWWMHFVVLPRGSEGRTLIGSGGYKGPPSDDGTVEIGYGIVEEHQRRGYATEATFGLLRRAFEVPTVRRARAESLPDLAPSIGVLRKCGFHLVGEGAEPGVIRFELTREDYEDRRPSEASHAIEIVRESIDSEPARALIQALNAEMLSRYPEEGTSAHFRLGADDVAPGRGAFLVAYAGGIPHACGAVRRLEGSAAEIARMYVAPEARGRGLGRRILEALESEARTLGAKTLVLETGPRQHEAIALYSLAGFSPIAAFGDYVESPLSLFMGKAL